MDPKDPKKEKEPTDAPEDGDGKWIEVSARCCDIEENAQADPAVEVEISFGIDAGGVTSVTVTADMAHPCGIRTYQITVRLIRLMPLARWEIVLPAAGPFDCPDAGGENRRFSRTWNLNRPNRLPVDDLDGWSVFALAAVVSCCRTAKGAWKLERAPRSL